MAIGQSLTWASGIWATVPSVLQAFHVNPFDHQNAQKSENSVNEPKKKATFQN